MLHVTVNSLCRANHGFGSRREPTTRYKLMLSGNWRPGGHRTYLGDMYRYDAVDKTLVTERVAQFRDQTRRFLAGELSEDEFRPLRLQNGLYIQKYAPMLRIAIPYGLLSSTQLRRLAHIG